MIEELIKFLGGGAMLLAAIAWLIRSLITHQLNKDVEDFKIKLQHESEIELQRAGHSLRLSGLEYEHRVALLQEKRAEVIAELYRLLVEFVESAKSYASLMEWNNEPDKDEKAKILGDKASEFKKYFVINRIYFSKKTCDGVDELWEKIIVPIQQYSFWRKQEDKSNGGALKAHDSWVEAYQTMTKEIPPFLEIIEDEFRDLLGV